MRECSASNIDSEYIWKLQRPLALFRCSQQQVVRDVMMADRNRDLIPCPFYIRYTREDKTDPNSDFALSDFNISHSHPLAPVESMVGVKAMVLCH